MGLFRKKEKTFEPKGKPLDFDPLNVQIKDLRPGFFVDYNFKTFEITGGFEYALKDYTFKALKFDAADEVLWVLIENGINTFLMEQLPIASVNPDLQKLMESFGKPPANLKFKETEHIFNREDVGKFRDLLKNEMDWSRLTCWKFNSGDGSSLVFALQKGQTTYEAIYAKTLSAGEFSNFLPKI